MRPLSRLVAVAIVAAPVLTGCGGRAPAEPGPRTNPAAEVDTASQELGGRLTDLINEATQRYQPLDYAYDEDLLAMLDRVEPHLAGKAPGPPPRLMPRLDPDEEVAHLRETVRRWTAKTGLDLRAEVDKLKAEVAARKPGEKPFHPEFHKRFSAAFDTLIPIEVAEIRERRNRYLHEKARPLFDGYREKHPDAVRDHEAFLNNPPYNLPTSDPAPRTP